MTVLAHPDRKRRSGHVANVHDHIAEFGHSSSSFSISWSPFGDRVPEPVPVVLNQLIIGAAFGHLNSMSGRLTLVLPFPGLAKDAVELVADVLAGVEQFQHGAAVLHFLKRRPWLRVVSGERQRQFAVRYV